ncbi:MAG: hypothetical protein WB699_14550 [Bacteroidota bacterium]
MKYPGMAATVGMMLTGAFLLLGCTKDTLVAPLSEQEGPILRGKPQAAPALPATNVVLEANDSTIVSNVTVIVWPYPNQPGADQLSDSVYVTPDSGGTVKVKWTNYDPAKDKLSTVSFKLRIPAGAVSSPKTISITVDKNAPEISAEFGPSGTVFLTPALLDVQVTGLDLSAFSATDRIDLWYVNASGWVGTMQYDKFKFDITRGTFAVSDLRIPHFSRYCFGR